MDSVVKLDNHLMARVEKENYIFEVNYDELKIKDVVLVFYRHGERVGSIYNDDGTNRTMARLETRKEEDFISTRVSKSFVNKVINTSKKEGFISKNSGTSIEAYRNRMDIK